MMNSQKKGSLLTVAGVSREFLEGLPPLSSRAAQLLLLPLALKVQYTKNYNDNCFYISKKEMVKLLNLSKSYKDEGHINQYISDILSEELFNLKVCDIPIIESVELPRGWLEITYTEEAMDRFFQGLSVKYFTISLDTISKMKNCNTFNIIKKMILAFDFSNPKVQVFKRHTKTLKEIMGFSKESYTREADGSFDRSSFEKNTIKKVISDLLTMEQFKLYPVKRHAECEKAEYLGKEKVKGTRLVDNYYICYQIIKPKIEKENDEYEED